MPRETAPTGMIHDLFFSDPKLGVPSETTIDQLNVKLDRVEKRIENLDKKINSIMIALGCGCSYGILVVGHSETSCR